jgi:hypothetical protein
MREYFTNQESHLIVNSKEKLFWFALGWDEDTFTFYLYLELVSVNMQICEYNAQKMLQNTNTIHISTILFLLGTLNSINCLKKCVSL